MQIAKALGAYVIGTASKAKEEYVKTLGADEFIDYRSERFEDSINNMDAALAAVGGDDIIARSLQVIRKGGRLISLLDDFDQDIAKQHSINFERFWVTPNATDLKQIAQLIDNGKINVNIDTVFPFSQIKQAHLLSESKRACGKIIINVAA